MKARSSRSQRADREQLNCNLEFITCWDFTRHGTVIPLLRYLEDISSGNLPPITVRRTCSLARTAESGQEEEEQHLERHVAITAETLMERPATIPTH